MRRIKVTYHDEEKEYELVGIVTTNTERYIKVDANTNTYWIDKLTTELIKFNGETSESLEECEWELDPKVPKESLTEINKPNRKEKSNTNKRYIVQISDFNYNTNTWQYKNRKHVATIEEAKKLKKELSYKEARIFDRITRKYL